VTRGTVVQLAPSDIVARALYLAGEVTSAELDPHVRNPAKVCATGYYRLKDHNGGKDPTAPDPFTRWQGNVTSDCMGGAAWCGGFDRYQPARFPLYDGWINTDSMVMDTAGPKACFRALPRPEPGCFIVCRSGTPGHRVGHIGVVVDVPAEWDRTKRECWEAIGVVDIAARKGRANRRTTGRGWFGAGAVFAVSTMRP
jgi:hypothetical protein